jgi:hypothetical protein
MPDDNASVDLVKRQYLQQIPVRYFQWPKLSPSLQNLLWEQVFLAMVNLNSRFSRLEFTVTLPANDISI